MLLLLDLLQEPSDVTFETLTAELKSLLLEEKNWISDWLRKIKCSCWFVLSGEEKMIFWECFLLQMVLEILVLCPCFQERRGLCRCLPFWTRDVFLLDIDFKCVCWCVFTFVAGKNLLVSWVFLPLMNSSFPKFSCGIFFFFNVQISEGSVALMLLTWLLCYLWVMLAEVYVQVRFKSTLMYGYSIVFCFKVRLYKKRSYIFFLSFRMPV